MSEKLHIGAAWEETTVADAEKRYYRVAVDLGGMIPSISCRIVENAKPKSERSPSHIMFFSPVDGDDRVVGAFWPHKSEETGKSYLMGQITPSRFGIVELKGGAKLDLRLAGGAVGVKLVAAKADGDSEGKNRPTHYLLRTVPRSKRATVSGETDVDHADEDTGLDEQEAA